MSVDVPGQSSDLVSQLYDPANTGNPAKIKAIQEHLQILQKGPQAWLIANNLLSDESTDLRFFGALTFTVKINQDWYVKWYTLVAIEYPDLLVSLASSLATIFLKPNAPWNQALWNLAASLANGKHLSEEQCQSFDLQDAVLPAMSERQVVSLLYFSNILAEEINRWSPESRRNGDSNRASENIKHAFLLVEFVLRHMLQQESSGHSISDGAPGVEAINSYQVSMPIPIQGSSSNVRTLVMGLSPIFSQDHLYSILEYIISDLGTAHIASIMDADFEDENMTFLELLLAYATLKQRELLIQPLNSEHEKVLALLHTLFQAPGYAAVDDSASPLVLEWWTEVADDLQEIYLDTEEEEEGLDPAKRNLARAAMDCFEKLKYPSPEELQEWGDDDRSEFGAFRRDVCDFLLAIYPMLGLELVQVFQERAKSSLVQQDWRTFEAAIFCMAQLSEAVDENQHADACLNAIFFCDEFAQLCTGDVAMIPDKPRQTLVDMLGKYQSYFERTHALLPRVLTFLFASLDVASCASVASKSISHLCKSCRNALTFELPAFMDQFERFRFKPTATASTMEKVLEGIAAIVQTLPTDNEKAQFLERILKFFQEQAELARDEASRGLVEPARCRGQLVLRCVASIGKGLRTDGEIILDTLDGRNGDPYPPTFWNTGNGAVSQNLIMQCMQLLMTDFPLDVTIIEAACDILKAGFTENSGPYVFPPMVTVNFVKSIPLGSAGTDMVMGTASAFLASHSAHPQRIREETVALIVNVYETFCWMHEKPEFYDPEVANSGIDFLTRLLPKYHPFLFALTAVPQDSNQAGAGHVDGAPQRPPVLQAILNFTLLSLQGPEPLPLRSASQFWVGVLNLPYEEEAVQRALRDSIPALCRILASQVAGRCARSDLEHLCEVLRRLIFKQQGLARPHLATALADLGIDQTNQNQGPAVSPEERQRFLASLLAARGAKAQTSQLTRSFWVKCRGSGFDYIGFGTDRMPLFANSPEALANVTRTDSLDPATTCKGVTGGGKPCRRALSDTKMMYCWQHKDQAVAVSNGAGNKPNTSQLHPRSSIDTLMERLNIRDSLDNSNRYRPFKTKKKTKRTLCCCFEIIVENEPLPPRPVRPSSQNRPQSMQQVPSSAQRPQKGGWIPPTLSPQASSALTEELAKPLSEKDEPGYIYIFWITPADHSSRSMPPPTDVGSSLFSKHDDRGNNAIQKARDLNALTTKPTEFSPGAIRLKIGRANNVQRRMNEWTKQCNHHITLIRYYPYTPSSPGPSSGPALEVGRKVPYVHRVERLIHLELDDYRVRDMGKCSECGREHQEWFEIKAQKEAIRSVDECIRRWVRWAESQ
ncbi:unnamed protein product [Aspergillus oryzae]|nr:unnamed protein product [Aspergillus oryzae]GMF90270.1 unnamed protein product [Aspergillus oryzae]